MSYTVVCFHAHPDDESLLTAGTMARAAAEGHRVVLVLATAGEAGLASTELGGPDLAGRRLAELERSARVLGVSRVHCLGYADSGMPNAPSTAPDAFSAVPVEDAASKLADLLRAESADVLTTYDAAGGYGHYDHVQVNRVGARAAEIAGTPVVLQATIDRTLLLRVLRVLGLTRRMPTDFDPTRFRAAYTPRSALTHRVDVGAYAGRKRESMQAHASQASADTGDRTLAFCLRLPRPIFRLVFRYEWFLQPGRAPSLPLVDDIFASLRERL